MIFHGYIATGCHMSDQSVVVHTVEGVSKKTLDDAGSEKAYNDYTGS
jgi:hypothetical protein